MSETKLEVKELRRIVGNAVCAELSRMPQSEIREALDALRKLEELALRDHLSEGVVVEIDLDEDGIIGVIYDLPDEVSGWMNEACGPAKARLIRIEGEG